MDDKDPLEPFYKKIDYNLDGGKIDPKVFIIRIPKGFEDAFSDAWTNPEEEAKLSRLSAFRGMKKGGEVDLLDVSPPAAVEKSLSTTKSELVRIMQGAKAMQTKKNKYR